MILLDLGYTECHFIKDIPFPKIKLKIITVLMFNSIFNYGVTLVRLVPILYGYMVVYGQYCPVIDTKMGRN